MNNLIKEIKKFNKERDWDKFHSLKNLAISISIEANELLENFQWTDTPDHQKVKDEIADIFIYLLNFCDKCGMDELDIIHYINVKIEKNKTKYPIEKSKGNCKKYNEL